MKKTIFTFVFFLFANIALAQKTINSVKPINTIQQLTDSIERLMQQEHIIGLMLGITTRDSVLFSGGFGYANIAIKRRVDENTLFRMGSITKMLVSLGAMKLVNEGKLKLDDELKKIAPELAFQNNWEATNPLRIVNLLEHTSGFDDIKLNRMYAADAKENTSFEQMLVHKNSMICRWKPSERFAYSNPNYAILGYLIEKITGTPYNVYLQENIMSQIGMLHSNFNLNSKYPQEDVTEYIVKSGQAVPVKSVTLLSGAQGALWSSSADMLQLLQLFLRNGSPIFPLNTIAEIETSHSSLSAKCGQKNGYGLGNEIDFCNTAKYPFRGHNGLTGTCFSGCKYNRELGIGYVLASNCNNNNAKIEGLIVEYLERNLPNKPLVARAIDPQKIAPFLGRYQFESPRNAISGFADKLQNAPEIYLESNKLYFKPFLGEASELIQTSDMTFAWRGSNTPMICFTKNDDGENVLLIGGSYFEKTSNFWAIFKRVTLIFAILLALSSVVFGIFSLLRAIFGKTTWKTALPH
ncbi:MAG: hypothetical protein RI894_2628, partial [Bacteroidota bacterium]